MKPKLVKSSLTEPHPYVVKKSGRSVRLNCSFTGNPIPEVIWLKDSNPNFAFEPRPNGDHFAVSNDSLYMENLSPVDSGNYTCFAQNSLGEASFTYFLDVEVNDVFPPRINDALLTDVHAKIGDNVSLQCEHSSTLATIIQWNKIEKNGQKTPLESTDHFLHLTNINEETTGTYECVTINKYGRDARTVNVTIHEEPVVQQMFESHRRRSLYTIASLIVIVVVIALLFIYKLYQFKKKRVTIIKAQNSFIIRKRVVLEHEENGKSLSPLVKIECEKVSCLDASPEDMKRALNEYHFPLDPAWEVSRDRLKLGSLLGQGAFGVVHQATLHGVSGKQTESTEVAVKMLKNGHSENDVRDLVSEMEVMKKVGGHKHIINLLGCVTQDGMFFGLFLSFASQKRIFSFFKFSCNFLVLISSPFNLLSFFFYTLLVCVSVSVENKQDLCMLLLSSHQKETFWTFYESTDLPLDTKLLSIRRLKKTA